MRHLGAVLLSLSGFVVLPVVTFLAVHRWTAVFFRRREIPLPFDAFGLAAGLGAASWTLAAAFWIARQIQKRRSAP
ncbi:MAG TPA: hypothetical protein VL404_04560 [Candidatus Eisenbacteria bacterium]|nr:hypothetical protein [Candidatus Eisenbacteria bacterium]